MSTERSRGPLRSTETAEPYKNTSLKNIPKADTEAAITVQELLQLHKAVLEELRTTNGNFSALATTVQGLAERIDSLIGRVEKLENEHPAAEKAEIAGLVTQAIEEQERRKRKECRAVIERMPEGADDVEKVTELVRKCDSDTDLVPEQIHRHGEVKGKVSKRIIKVPFTSKMARDKFIKNFWSYARNPEFRQLYPGISVRRDLTPEELKLHYSLRSECYKRNADCGQFKYLYRNLHIITLSNPQPLKSQA